MREWWSKFWAMSRRRKPAADLEEELETHLEFEIEEKRAEGMAPDKAREAAQRSFGNRTRIQEDAREAWILPALENFWHDTQYAMRTMRKAPVFAVAAIVTLGLGIGANTAMFTVIRAVLLKPLEYRNPDRLVHISIDNARENYRDVGFSLVRYEAMKNARSFSELGAYFIATEHMTLSGTTEPEQVTVARISANVLPILGIKPILGRNFLPEEDRQGGRPVALISSDLWHRRFGGDPNITGKNIALNATSFSVIGVLPEGFAFPVPDIDLWVARPAEFSEMPARFWSHLTVLIGLGRLPPGVTLEQARSELDVLNRQYIKAHPAMPDATPGVTVRAIYLRDELVDNVRTMLWVLLATVAFVLIIACANVASLLLARATARSREFAVRAALGAGRARLIRQLLAESVLLAVLGGTVGVLLALWSLKMLTHVTAFHLPRADEIHVDGMVLAFTVVLSIVTGVFFGLFPSVQVSRPGLVDSLRDRAGNVENARGNNGTFGISIRRLLVTGQVALSVMLLIGAALLMESFFRLHGVNPGFNSTHLLTMRISLPPARYDTPQKKRIFFDELLRRVEALPGVHGAAAALALPMSPQRATEVQVAEQPVVPLSQRPSVALQSVTPSYFRTAGLPVLRGRAFTDHDNADGGPVVAIINESMARRFWPAYPGGQDPVGQHILLGAQATSGFQVIGIVGNVHERGLSTDAGAEIYLPTRFYPLQSAGFLVRTDGDPLRLASAIRRQVFAIDPNEPIAAVQTMTDLLDTSVGKQRLTVVLLGSFAGIAMLLAAIGIYGLIAYSVLQRTAEIGIRRALGAQTSDILGMVIGQSLAMTLAGLAIGIVGAFALTRLMAGLLFHVSPTDPSTFAAVALVFLAIAFVASSIPALRATRLDPMIALR